MKWFVKCFKQYADFRGRACRIEFWMFTLINILFSVAAALVDQLLGISVISYIYSLAVLVPSLAVCVRRLHDIGKSGWFYFICLIPLIGAIWLVVLFAKDGQPGENQWGVNPKEA